MDALDLDIKRVHSLHAIACGLTRLKWLAAAERFELAMRRHDRALKYNFNPAQPRDELGKWTDTGAGGDGRIRLAGDIPTGDSPEIPKERPPTSRERSVVLKEVARRLIENGATVATLAKTASWLVAHSAEIESYRDLPRSMDELQRGVLTPQPGYQKHHIVEQTQAEDEGFAREVIDSPENLVLIPKMKHEEINGWFQRQNRDFDGMSPRDYLSGRSWEVRRAVGLDTLRKFGVLK